MALRTGFSKVLCSGPGPYTWANVEFKYFRTLIINKRELLALF